MIGWLNQTFACVALIGLLAGCRGKSGRGFDPNTFAQAAPEIKQAWEEASAADRTNGYASAQSLYFMLLRLQLSPQQRQAVEQASTGLNDRLSSALQKGDPDAKAALEELRRHPPNRPM
ncbi:MAG TPA: hypothetical protein VNZ64_08070 [Candidatus Acidoferrum sp.]|jgi:hypothetical protein|nr:hypothetical protein [Candidatus Acidoferrum sp.]